MVAGRFIGRYGNRRVLTAGLAVQGLATVPLIFLGADRVALAVLIPALFIGFFGHVTAIVAYTVTGTSGLPDEEQGLATGLTTMTQQVAITVGIPILSAVAATQTVELTGIRPGARRRRRHHAHRRGPDLARTADTGWPGQPDLVAARR